MHFFKMDRQQTSGVKVVAALALGLAALIPMPASATTIDMYDGIGGDFTRVDTFFTGFGYTVNQITSSFDASSIAGANFVIMSAPNFALSPVQLTALDNYVNGGGRLLTNSEWYPTFSTEITETNAILAALGSSIFNQNTASNVGFHDTSDILSNPFTAGVGDVNYADTSSLTGGTPLVFGNPVTDLGQEFIAYEAIGSGDVFVIADSNTATNINFTATNNNGLLYCNFGGLSCASTTLVPEPTSLFPLGFGLAGLGVARRRRKSAAAAAGA
jgi:hypothetical protein